MNLNADFTMRVAVHAASTYRAQSWLRLPIGAHFSARVAPDGCRVWMKEGHLRHVHAEQPTADIGRLILL